MASTPLGIGIIILTWHVSRSLQIDRRAADGVSRSFRAKTPTPMGLLLCASWLQVTQASLTLLTAAAAVQLAQGDAAAVPGRKHVDHTHGSTLLDGRGWLSLPRRLQYSNGTAGGTADVAAKSIAFPAAFKSCTFATIEVRR